MRTAFAVVVVVVALSAAALPPSATASLSSLSALHGISPTLQRTLATASSFTCDGGTKRFALDRLNDNYCDCRDGSDEPGTSACSHTSAVFHCANAGFFAHDIPTSRVNDGICDCCDGSDEYASSIHCPTTCPALMAAFETDRAAAIATMEAGEADRKTIVTASAAAYDADVAALAALEATISSLTVQLEQQEAICRTEDDREQLERIELLQTNQHALLATLGIDRLSTDQLSGIVDELSKRFESVDELLALIKREREAVTNGDANTPLPLSPIEELEAAYRIRDDARQRETERIEALREERRIAREANLQHQQIDDSDESDKSDTSSPGIGNDNAANFDTTAENVDNDDDLTIPDIEERPSKKLFDDLQNLFHEHTRQAAIDARTTKESTAAKLESHKSELQTLKSKLEASYGPDNVFYSLRDACFETQSGEYLYSLCLFGAAKQSATRLGTMQTITEDESKLEFTGGDKCWNGPERSLSVTLECGALPVELYEVDEPATCVYTAKLRTPVACDTRNRDRVMAPPPSTFSAEVAAPHHVEVEVAATL